MFVSRWTQWPHARKFIEARNVSWRICAWADPSSTDERQQVHINPPTDSSGRALGLTNLHENASNFNSKNKLSQQWIGIKGNHGFTSLTVYLEWLPLTLTRQYYETHIYKSKRDNLAKRYQMDLNEWLFFHLKKYSSVSYDTTLCVFQLSNLIFIQFVKSNFKEKGLSYTW